MVTTVWVVSRLRLKGSSRYLIFIYISPLTSSGQRSRASWAPKPQKSATLSPQPGGKTAKFVRTSGGIGGEKNKYCHLWPARLYSIFSTLSHKPHDFRKKVVQHKMCVLIFFTIFVWIISHYKKKWARYDKKIYIGLHVEYLLFFLDFKEIGFFFRQFFEKYSNIKFHENPSCGSRICSMRRDGGTDMPKLLPRFPQFCERT